MNEMNGAVPNPSFYGAVPHSIASPDRVSVSVLGLAATQLLTQLRPSGGPLHCTSAPRLTGPGGTLTSPPYMTAVGLTDHPRTLPHGACHTYPAYNPVRSASRASQPPVVTVSLPQRRAAVSLLPQRGRARLADIPSG